MAELKDFGVSDRITLLHKIDPRVKILGLTGLSVAIFNAHLPGMVAGTLAIILLCMPMLQGVVRIFGQLRGFLILMTGVLVANAVFTPGITLFSIWKISFSLEGVQAGLIFYWRIVLVIVIGYIVTASTSVTGIRNAVNWIFHFIPFFPYRALSDMMGLLVRFLPMILMRSHLIGEAQKSRGIQFRKNPIYRIRVFSISLLRQSFLSADQLSMAMASRCYHRKRPIHSWPFRKFDILCILSLGVLVSIFLFLQ